MTLYHFATLRGGDFLFGVKNRSLGKKYFYFNFFSEFFTNFITWNSFPRALICKP